MRQVQINTRQQRRSMVRAVAKGQEFSLVRPHAAGIDLGSKEHYVAVPPELNQPVRQFSCTTWGLRQMAEWLVQCGVKTIAMEATGVYWVPVVEMLEQYGLEACLVDARQTHNVTGRKSDEIDCEWIRKLHSFGLLSPAFRPDKSMVALRSLWRHRDGLVRACAEQIQLMHKALEQMNVQLHKVLSDVSGRSGMQIIRAILAGERDGLKLAALCHAGVKRSRADVARALEGNYRGEHVFTLRQAVEAYDFFQRQLEDCDRMVEGEMAKLPSQYVQPAPASGASNRHTRRKNQPYFDLRSELQRTTGADLTMIEGLDAVTVFKVISEIGTDVSRFPSEKNFASWLLLAPNHRITGGRIHSRRVRPGSNRAGQALKVAAQSLHHSKSALGAFYRRMKARLGPQKAIVATAHKLAILIYRILKYGEAYVSQSEARYLELTRERTVNHLTRKARQLGFQLVNTATGELVS